MMRRLMMIVSRQMMKNRAVKAKAWEAPRRNQALLEYGMLTSMNTSENRAVNVTDAISWYFARK